ncbi:ImmA/IrrE family metallo-endopeptidase [Metasolibacillus meyeri]|uniref:ImmA/IrrE family metallo-endopeptidase n=1 Tax=Metasolibacillus meyeri TaxID=1071052 RepID=A0AAW9NGE7_9BACL|nr:ImmA/IrrE family metallo-endopeptidase [Metasolibacillus meyeri]MEC1177664.1 ImmA/IrrE family metallo-endopeptidase [Metasolibacillus meyeri]
MSQIKTLVNQLVVKYGTNDPFELAYFMGVLIIYEPLGSALGYYNKHFRVPMIHINEDLNKEAQFFVCAHELGHFVQHTDVNTSFLKKHTFLSTDKLEIEANTFAIELLLPDKYFYEQTNTNFTIYDAVESYGVPTELLALKCIDNKKFYP